MRGSLGGSGNSCVNGPSLNIRQFTRSITPPPSSNGTGSSSLRRFDGSSPLPSRNAHAKYSMILAFFVVEVAITGVSNALICVLISFGVGGGISYLHKLQRA